MKHFLQRQIQVSLDWWILLLATSTLQTSETHAKVAIDSVIEFWNEREGAVYNKIVFWVVLCGWKRQVVWRNGGGLEKLYPD